MRVAHYILTGIQSCDQVSLENAFAKFYKLCQQSNACTAHQAGEVGLDSGISFGDYAGFSWRWTWLRLRDYYGTDNGLVKEVGYWKNGKHLTKLVITQAGVEFYRQQSEQYRTLYPNVDAPISE